MRLLKITILPCFLILSYTTQSQNIGDFTSVTPAAQTNGLVIPSSHSFQRIIKVGDALTVSGTMLTKPDFTAFVPIAGSSTNGYLSVNSEDAPIAVGGTGGGGVTILDINLNATSKLWEITTSQTLNFAAFGGTAANCSGTVTSWGTVISCEEVAYNPIVGLVDFNFDGYNDVGWNIELNPATRTVLGKHWAMGNMAHENVAIHSNERTVYQGADSNPGYLYKFVATNAQDLSAGNLYVFVESGLDDGNGTWVQINNTTINDRNTTIALSDAAGGTVFNGIEDVEIGPDGMVYFAAKGSPDRRVYRFQDSDPVSGTTVSNMETFVGNTDTDQSMSYDIDDGSSTTSVEWGSGNDNLAFDGDGNLWVFQDGGNNYIWVVGSDHDQNAIVPVHNVKIFGSAPLGAEPTGITFTPDYKYLFMSTLVLNDPTTNNAGQMDAAGNTVNFNTGTTLVISLKENLGTLSTDDPRFNTKTKLLPNPLDTSRNLVIKSKQIQNVKLFSLHGEKILDKDYNYQDDVELSLKGFNSGLYLIKINDKQTTKLVIK